MNATAARTKMEASINSRNLEELNSDLTELGKMTRTEAGSLVHCMIVESIEARFPEIADLAWAIIDTDEVDTFGEALTIARAA